jgi:hypothetical protein
MMKWFAIGTLAGTVALLWYAVLDPVKYLLE